MVTVGTLYIPTYNNIPWSQPGGTGTKVYPGQANNQPFTAYPVGGQVIDEVGQSLWIWGCGHGSDVVKIFKDYDPGNKSSIALICCPICTFIASVIEPYEAIFDVTQYPIIIGGG